MNEGEEKNPRGVRGVVITTILTMAFAIISIAIVLHKLASRPTSGGTTQIQNSAPTVSAPVGAQPKPAVAEKVTAQPSEKTETVLNKYGLTATQTVGVTPTINTNN